MPLQSKPQKDQPQWGLVFSFYHKWKVRQRSRALMGSRKIIRTSTGLELHALGKLNWSLQWNEVTGVVAYKRDLGSVDQISFGFRILDDQQHYFVIDEDTPGFKSIEDDLSKRTKGAWIDKISEVTSPAFELCWTELWVAPGTPSLTNNPYLHKIAPESESDF